MIEATTTLSLEEWNELSDGLTEFHNIFYRFWTVCRPEFTDKIPTAAVAFDKDGNCIAFMLNYEFWQKLTLNQKLFVICHECLHLILNHGKRGKRIFTKGEIERKKLNVAMDICVNEILIERYGFLRNEIDPDNKYVWADKVAAQLGLPGLATDRCFEYYYNLFKSAPDEPFTAPDGGTPAVGGTVDEHSGSGDDDTDASDALGRVASELDEGELQDLDNMLQDERNTLQRDTEDSPNFQAGSDPLGHTFSIKFKPVEEKKKWESVIKNWAKKQLVDADREVEQWARTARRFSLLDRTLALPHELEVEHKNPTKKKIEVWFFLDTSGSCINLAERFFDAARSLPTKRFDVHLYCFDTVIYPSDLKHRKVSGGGGTRFDIMEKYIIKNTVKKGGKYPDGVFVITDGLGNVVNPQMPERWFWFLSELHLQCIPKESKYYNLKDFE